MNERARTHTHVFLGGSSSENEERNQWEDATEMMMEEMRTEVDGLKGRIGALEGELARSDPAMLVCTWMLSCVDWRMAGLGHSRAIFGWDPRLPVCVCRCVDVMMSRLLDGGIDTRG